MYIFAISYCIIMKNIAFSDHYWPFLTHPKIRISFLRVQRFFGFLVIMHLQKGTFRSNLPF